MLGTSDERTKYHGGVERDRIFEDIPVELENLTYNLLCRLSAFASDENLRTRFVTTDTHELKYRLPSARSTDERISKTLKFLRDESKLEIFLRELGGSINKDDYDKVVMERVIRGWNDPKNYTEVVDADMSYGKLVDFGDGVTSQTIREHGVGYDVVNKLGSNKIFNDDNSLREFFNNNALLKPFSIHLESANSVQSRIQRNIAMLMRKRHREYGSVLEIFLAACNGKPLYPEAENKKEK